MSVDAVVLLLLLLLLLLSEDGDDELVLLVLLLLASELEPLDEFWRLAPFAMVEAVVAGESLVAVIGDGSSPLSVVGELFVALVGELEAEEDEDDDDELLELEDDEAEEGEEPGSSPCRSISPLTAPFVVCVAGDSLPGEGTGTAAVVSGVDSGGPGQSIASTGPHVLDTRESGPRRREGEIENRKT